jgi:hypothetical protein
VVDDLCNDSTEVAFIEGTLNPSKSGICVPIYYLVGRPEAVHMDAQQRLLLERAWEALQAAPDQASVAAAARTAVIVGIGTVDYTSMSAHLGVGIYVATGAPHNASSPPSVALPSHQGRASAGGDNVHHVMPPALPTLPTHEPVSLHAPFG